MRHVEATTGTFISVPLTPNGARLTTEIPGCRVSARNRGLVPMSAKVATDASAKRIAARAAIGAIYSEVSTNLASPEGRRFQTAIEILITPKPIAEYTGASAHCFAIAGLLPDEWPISAE